MNKQLEKFWSICWRVYRTESWINYILLLNRNWLKTCYYFWVPELCLKNKNKNKYLFVIHKKKLTNVEQKHLNDTKIIQMHKLNVYCRVLWF